MNLRATADMPIDSELSVLVASAEKSEIDAVKNHWVNAQSVQDLISKFDSLSKGWDRLANAIFIDSESISFRFKKLAGMCSSVAGSRLIDAFFVEVNEPIKIDLEQVEKDAQRDFDRAKKHLYQHRKNRLDNRTLTESIGLLRWTVPSNSMHGRKTTSGSVGPTNRDEQICGLGADIFIDMYKSIFPNW